MPRIAIDCRFGSIHGGLGTYVRGIVPALIAASGNTHQFFLFITNANDPWVSPLLSNPAVEVIRVPYKHYSIAEHLLFPRTLRKVKANLLFVPHFNAPLFTTVPTVISVHDMILHTHSNTTSFFRRVAYRTVFRLALWKAKAIVTVSEATKNHVLATFPSLQKKVTTVYPGISPFLTPSSAVDVASVRSKFELRSPYFLYIGNAKEHKNVQVLIDAFADAHLQEFELVLLTGGKEAEGLQLSQRVRRLSDVPEHLLPHLLSGASALVTATKMEGFCLPVIEAMACRVPVLASNIEPLPEVTRGHAVLIPPDRASFADGFRRMAEDPQIRTQERLLSAQDFTTAYTWNAAADRLVPLFNALLR